MNPVLLPIADCPFFGSKHCMNHTASIFQVPKEYLKEDNWYRLAGGGASHPAFAFLFLLSTSVLES